MHAAEVSPAMFPRSKIEAVDTTGSEMRFAPG
jgi:hypothetical protein